MKILAIESSAVAASAAVLSDGALLSEEFSQNGLTHSVTLLPMVESALEKAKLDINDIDKIAVTVGPGSFSGLRIGVSLAKMLAYGVEKKTVGVSTLEAIAFNLPFADRIICPIMDARRDQVYNAMYRFEEGKLITLREPRAISKEELAAEIDEPVVFIGDGVPRFRDYFENELGDKASFAPLHLCAARASSVAALAQHKEETEAEELVPCYIRLSQAEREYEEKHKRG